MRLWRLWIWPLVLRRNVWLLLRPDAWRVAFWLYRWGVVWSFRVWYRALRSLIRSRLTRRL